MTTKFDCDIVNGLSNAVCGRVDLLEKMLGVKVRENLRYSDIQKIVKSGFAEEFFDIGDEIMTKYTTTDGTEYDFPWLVVDFRDVEWENDPAPHPGMVLMSKYASVETITYGVDPRHTVPNDETIAEEGWYYFAQGSAAYIQTPLNLNPGDTIPHDKYNNIHKVGINVSPTGDGLSDYIFTSVRQWLNSDAEAGHWWTPMFLGDNEPSEHDIYNGFMHGFDPDFINTIVPTRLLTWHIPDKETVAAYSYERFHVPSPIELYFISEKSNEHPGEDKPFEYYKKLINSMGYDYAIAAGVDGRKFYLLNDHTTVPFGNRVRTINKYMFGHAQTLSSSGALGAFNPAGSRKNVISYCVIS